MNVGCSPFKIPRGFTIACAMAAMSAGALCASRPDTSSTVPARRPSSFDDALQPLATEHPRSQMDRDHLEAIALFAAGNTHERRDELAQALRCYERAFRFDPQAGAIVRAIVSAAVRLKRYPEALRYVQKADKSVDFEPLLLRCLGLDLADQGDIDHAVQLYERAVAVRGRVREKETAADILLCMEMGRLYHMGEKHKLAAECFAKVVYALDHRDEFAIDDQLKDILFGEPEATYILLGQCFLLADRADDALAAFKKADAIAPNPSLLQFNLARVYAKSGKPGEALAALESCFAAHLIGEGSAPYETLADVLKQLGRSAELIPRLEKLHADDAQNMPLAFFLAAQYRAAGNVERAESAYLELAQHAATPTCYRNLIDLCRETKRYDALLTTLGRAMDEVGVLETLGAESQSISSNAELMRSIVETARAKYKADPNQFTAGMRQAAALLALEAKQLDVAGEFFELALAVTKPKETAEMLLAWGVGLLLNDRASEAVKVFQRGIDEKVLPSDNPAFCFYLAGALATCDRIDEALVAARKAADMKKDIARFRARVAWVLYYAKRYAEAKQTYQEMIKEFDAQDALSETRAAQDAFSETRAVMREARLVLSNVCVVDNNLPEAEEWLEQVLDEFPDDIGALNDLGYLWADQNKNLERAQKMIQQAVDAEPDNAAFRDSLGWVLFRFGRYAEAVTELEKAAAGEKIDGVVLDHLGDAYQKVNQPDKALDAWRRAVETLRGEKESEKAAAVEKKIPK